MSQCPSFKQADQHCSPTPCLSPAPLLQLSRAFKSKRLGARAAHVEAVGAHDVTLSDGTTLPVRKQRAAV